MRLQELHVAKAGPGWDKHLQKNLRPLQLHGHQQPPVLSMQTPTSPPKGFNPWGAAPSAPPLPGPAFDTCAGNVFKSLLSAEALALLSSRSMKSPRAKHRSLFSFEIS